MIDSFIWADTIGSFDSFPIVDTFEDHTFEDHDSLVSMGTLKAKGSFNGLGSL